MENVLKRYLGRTVGKIDAPHKDDSEVRARPSLSELCVRYAAMENFLMKEMHGAMRVVELPAYLRLGVEEHCRCYEKVFRNRKDEIRRLKDFVVEDHPIVLSTDL